MNLPDLPFALEEAMNRLRVNIKFCGNQTRKILVTSSIPNEGKSFVSVQLWRMLAEAGTPTLMLDLDLRNSVLSSRHDMKSDGEIIGLNYYLSGMNEIDDVIYETNVENGFVIPVTNLLENPSVLFEDPRFAELLEELSKRYRYIIVDSPPLIDVADGAMIASLCDGTVLVVRSAYTSKKLVHRSVHQLEQADCTLLGMVQNRVDVSGRRYGYGKGYGYGYGRYGYGQYGYGQYGYGRGNHQNPDEKTG